VRSVLCIHRGKKLPEVATLLRRAGGLLPPKISYALRKRIGHRSVRRFQTYSEYLSAREAKTLENAPGELQEAWQARDYAEYMDAFAQASVRRDIDYVRFAQAAIDIGEPERLLELTRCLPPHIWRRKGFRKHYFTALVSIGQFSEAAEFARNMLILGENSPEFLLKVIGESYLLNDDQLSVACATRLSKMRPFPDKLGFYVRNVLMNQIGDGFLLSLDLPAIQDSSTADFNFFMSNVARFRNDFTSQVERFNLALEQYGLVSVSLLDESSGLSVTNVTAESPRLICDGPKVSIMMSTFNAGATIVPVLRSLAAQSYRNIEVLVVDDCSTDKTVDLAYDFAQRDGRFRVLQMPRNGGTYKARNRGLMEASGEFFLCNDSDDWSHPDRVAELVAPLIASHEFVASLGRLVRLNEKVGVKPKIGGYVHDDQSSFCYRRAAVVDRIGYYDTAPFGADTEFFSRAALAFGEGTIARVKKPLLLADWSRRSLSGAIGTGITDGGTFAPVRRRYRTQYKRRHTTGHLRIEAESNLG